MWTFRCEPLANLRGAHFALFANSTPVSYAQTLELWRDSPEFCAFFGSLLADSPFAASRWETPAVTSASVGRPFEFVLLDDPGLARRPDSNAFAEHFDGAPSEGVVEFSSLGRDAILIAPTPGPSDSAYCHLAAFLRSAPEAQRHALWQQVGSAMGRRVNAAPVWLSTAGGGVPWLHVRLDDRPKYYGYRPYRDGAAQP